MAEDVRLAGVFFQRTRTHSLRQRCIGGIGWNIGHARLGRLGEKIRHSRGESLTNERKCQRRKRFSCSARRAPKYSALVREPFWRNDRSGPLRPLAMNLKTILVPIDFSDVTRKVVETAGY